MLATMNGVQGPMGPTLDPELSFIASQAAIELDNLLLRKSSKFTAVAQLAKYLRGSSNGVSGSNPSFNTMDPQTIDVVSRAIDASGEDSIKTLEDLRNHAGRLATELTDMKGSSEDGVIERLRSFCVSLSQVATAQRQTIMDMHPSHPFRD